MDVVTHGLAGALVVRAVRGQPGWLPIAATVGGALFPDLDVVGRLWDTMASITFHRTVTHSFIGGLVLAAGIAGILRLRSCHHRFLSLMRFAYLGVLSHVTLEPTHPLAAAIVTGAEASGVILDPAENFRAVPGKGITGTVGGHAVLLGNRALFEEAGVGLEGLADRVETLRRDGQTVMFVAVDGQPAGALGVADPVKASTPEAIRMLRVDGVRLVMLTGDSRTTAEAVARRLRIDAFEAEVLPAQKSEVVKRLQAEGRVVAMAGDGVNDAPALAQAHVGIAMGTGTDVAMESAGVTLVKGDLRGIARARRLSRGPMRNIRQNLFFAFVYNALGVPLAAGVLYPVFGLLLSPIVASAAMTFSSVSVIGNALRLRRLPL
jgi:Cu+-exporting ATPase